MFRLAVTTTDLGIWLNGNLVLYLGTESFGLAHPEIGFI